MDPISALIAAIGTVGSAGINYASQSSANSQNMMMNTGAWKAQQVSDEAKALGVSPLAILGNTGGTTPMQAVQLPDMGQSIGRAAAAMTEKDDRLTALQVQRAELENKLLTADLTDRQLRNAKNAVAFQPSVPLVPLPREDPRYESDIKPGLQRFNVGGNTVYGPSAPLQQSLWSPIPGLPANPAVLGEVMHQNLPPGTDDPIRPDFSRYWSDMSDALAY